VRALLREGPIKGRLAELDCLLVAHFREASDGSLAGLSDEYGLRHLIAHLGGAGEVDAARSLLADPAWLSNKLHRLGIQLVLADYATLPHRDGALDLINAALTVAAPALARNPRELAAQLLARLAPGDAAGLDEFLSRARGVLSPPTLTLSRPTVTPPGAELRRFEGHENAVTSVAVLADGRRALSASDDRTLRLWDLETGVALARLIFDAVTTTLALSPQQGRIVVGDGLGRIHVVELIE
jgi:WD domain, G-beta repeat